MLSNAILIKQHSFNNTPNMPKSKKNVKGFVEKFLFASRIEK